MIHLTKREKEILELSTTLSTKEIANKLYIEPETVKLHKTNLFHKLGVNSITTAIWKALELGLMECPCPKCAFPIDDVVINGVRYRKVKELTLPGQ